jgi:hypothetical protein
LPQQVFLKLHAFQVSIKGRNSYAHVAICIKNKFNNSYKDIDDSQLHEVLDYIEFLKNNPQ